MEQPGWPFENAIMGVTVRSEFEEPEEDMDENSNDKNSNDVFILEGRQLRYGNKDAWSGC